MFEDRKLLIATKHLKETVIAPLFRKEFRNYCYTSDEFDTDLLGTFSGEIDRKDDALTTLRKKCTIAHEATNSDLVIATEGSFGAHPNIFFAQANDELIMLKDFKNNIEIIAREISLETNFNGKTINDESELLEFSKQINFPSHALILKPSEKDFSKIFKGLNSEYELLKKYYELKNEYNSAYAETDMRAMFNPTRMLIIERVTNKLIDKIKKSCPNCECPGFDVVNIHTGLPCEMCLQPTRSTLSHLYKCKKCSFEKIEEYPRGLKFEDPTYCDFCNP